MKNTCQFPFAQMAKSEEDDKKKKKKTKQTVEKHSIPQYKRCYRTGL
jgi:hypothetical protein